MAALSTGDVILAKQAVGTWQGTTTFGVQPQMSIVMKAIWMGFATHKRTIKLEYLPFVGQAAFNVLVTGALKVYVFYVKKQDDATDSYQTLFDDATNDAGADTDRRITLPTLIANEEAVAFYPGGLDMAAGVVLASHTDSGGDADSSAAADTADGFVLAGDA